jgi:hypothetical protein
METHRPSVKSLTRILIALTLLGVATRTTDATGSGIAIVYKDSAPALGLQLANDQACFVDIDNDHFTDIICGGVIWHNERGKKFTNFGAASNVVAADYDNDGNVDLFSWSQRKLMRNLGNGKFADAALPILPAAVSRGACWTDFNNDGFVDLVIGGYEDWDRGITYPTFFLRNDAGKAFTNVVDVATSRTRGVTAADYDRDGNADIYMSNYRLQANNLYNIGKDGKSLRDLAPERRAVATSEGFDGGHSIGAAWGDIDNDGWLDLFAGNFAHVDSRGDQPKSRFLRNMGPSGKFVFDDLGTCGVFYQESYASPALADVDNDGRLDLFFTTVYGTASFGRKNNPVLLRNSGACWFNDVTAVAGIGGIDSTYQAAFGDIDNDGLLELASGGKLYRGTQAVKSHWLGVQLIGNGRTVNRSAIGAQVVVRLGRQKLVRQVDAGTGEGNQSDLRLHFGLGNVSEAVDAEVYWPDGTRQLLHHVQVDRMQVITQGGGRTTYR